MRPDVRLSIATVLVGVGLGGATAAVAATVTIAPLHGETAVESYGDVAVWSDYDAASRSRQESRRGESHPPALAEPDLNVSAHPAPIVQPHGRTPKRQW